MGDDMFYIIKHFPAALACLMIISAAPACAPAMQNIVLTTQVDPAGRALNSATDFSVDTPRIICSVSTAGLPATVAVQARWLYDDGASWKTFKE
jgi:hypothetical protein